MAHYRHGKKYDNGKEISAVCRLIFYADDGETVHTATRWEDGTTSCNCPRWTRYSRSDNRDCAHATRVAFLTKTLDETRPAADPGITAAMTPAPVTIAPGSFKRQRPLILRLPEA